MDLIGASQASTYNVFADRNYSNSLPKRVFLYLHPKSIIYTLDDIPRHRSEIEVKHQYIKISTVNGQYASYSTIQIDKFDIDKPTFTIMIEQDSLEDITMLSDCPVLLTLYVYTKTAEVDENYGHIRLPVAQGHIDVVKYFKNKRINSTDIVFLYPLENNGQNPTCKTEWDIYSLHPLLKTVVFSNFLHMSLESLYNIDEEIMNDSQNLFANISLISKMPNEKNYFDKILICNFNTFTKSIISEQNPEISWETLKSSEFENMNCMGVASGYKVVLNQLFSNLLCADNVKFNFSHINANGNFAVICNSMHRYMLTGSMQKILEEILSRNLYHIILEVHSAKDKRNILLQGYVDLSVFMYPNVNNCSFAVELRPPGSQLPSKASTKEIFKTIKYTSEEQHIKKSDIPFAIMKICLHDSITSSSQDMNESSSQKSIKTTDAELIMISNCRKIYRPFDDLIIEIEYLVNNNIQLMNDKREFLCNQLSNINNKIMKLVAIDFNTKTPTKSNIEFMNRITNVYGDIISRVYDCLNKCGAPDCESPNIQNFPDIHFIVKNMSLIKCLYESGNLEMANVIMNILGTKYRNNTTLKFYLFLYDIEKQNFESVKKYLQSSLDQKCNEGKLFEYLIEIYVNYKVQSKDFEGNKRVDEDLIKALCDYSKSHNSIRLTVFILLYCMYKKYNYQSGMEYCRWRYENLYNSKFAELQFIPKSLWEIYMPYEISLKSVKGQNFIIVCSFLLRLGLYNFAQWVFDEISDECMEIEKYYFSSTFMILKNKFENGFLTKTSFLDKLENPIQMSAVLSLVNGNLEYLMITESPTSIKHYQDIAELKELINYGPYQLGLFRYAYKVMKEEKYEQASHVFLKLCDDEISCVAAAVEKAKACYFLGQLDEAEKYFSISTEHDVYMESTWTYLALINIKKGNTFNALECWKYGRLKPHIKINEEILRELEKINYKDVCLFVDIPNKI